MGGSVANVINPIGAATNAVATKTGQSEYANLANPEKGYINRNYYGDPEVGMPGGFGVGSTAGGTFGGLMAANSEGQSNNYMRTRGGTNRYGEARPGTVLMRDMYGNLDERFQMSLSPEYQKLQEKGMTEGDTESAQLARARQQMMSEEARGALQRQGASSQASGMRNLAMRGGAGSGAQERIGRDVGRGMMAGSQGINRENRAANLGISMQDEAMKNQLLNQSGTMNQKIQEGNINRLQQDFLTENMANQNMYSEDMKALGAMQSAAAQANAGRKQGMLK